MESINDGIYPLAYGQRHLVHDFEIDPKIRLPLRRIYQLQDDLNETAFTDSIRYLTNKHPSLRLRLIRANSGWTQKFIEQNPVVTFSKVRGLFKTFRLSYGMLQLDEDIKPALNLEKECPVRATVFKINKELFLSLCIDHIAADEISFGLFEKELVECYEKAVSGELETCLPSSSFEKFILSEITNSNKEAGNLKYWYDKLKEIQYVNIPKSKKPLAVAGNYFKTFKKEEYEDLIEMTTASKYSVLVVAVAIYLLVIYGAKRINDTVIFVPFSNRMKEDDRLTIANIFMPLEVRFKWNPEGSILQMINGVRDALFNAIIHSQYDPVKLQGLIAQDSNGNIKPSTECNFILEENSLVYPNALFKGRLDTKAASKMISHGGFHLHARQYNERVLFRLTWDIDFWGINTESMNELFNKNYNLICEAIKSKD